MKGNSTTTDERKMLMQLFAARGVNIEPKQQAQFDAFLAQPQNNAALEIITQHANDLMLQWKTEERVTEIRNQPVRILNATVGRPYETKFDFDKWGWKDIVAFDFAGLEEVGLRYDEATKQLMGTPAQSGDLKFVFKFKIEGQAQDAPFAEKPFTFIVNPDPRSLWKKLDSDKADPWWKEDDRTVFAPLGDRHILASSKRGRSHANVGSFREDDFSFAALPNGWCLVVVADGAGSAKASRKGSVLACAAVVDYFMEPASADTMKVFDDLLQQPKNDAATTEKEIRLFVYNTLGKAVFQTHKKLEQFAAAENLSLKDLSSTLVFSLYKKYGDEYVFLSFGVGDCPAAVLNKDVSEVTQLNWIDVGEFGGGTRFITMPEIFKNEKFASRFSFKRTGDFSYLFLMSDGIYDPKFVVESALPDIKKWKAFLADLGGRNEEGAAVQLSADNRDIETQFSAWMDFWSPGNHDDRTLVIVF